MIPATGPVRAHASRRAGRRLRAAALLPLLVVAGACVTRTQMPAIGDPGQDGPGIAPTLVVERFLNASNAGDLQTMGRLFGTAAGSIVDRDGEAAVERRMYTIATVLRHSDYRVLGEGGIPGRRGEAIQVLVSVSRPQRNNVTVPFTVVRTRRDTWLVEQVDLEPLLAGR